MLHPTLLLYRGAVYRQAVPYGDEGFVGQRWGRQGSGLILTTGSSILLLHRSDQVEEPGTWGLPGGAVPVDTETGQPDDLLLSALREAEEELGSIPPHQIVDQYVYHEPSGFSYTTFIGLVSSVVLNTWRPRLNWENNAYGWFGLLELDHLDLHFGLVDLLQHKIRALFPNQPDSRTASALLARSCPLT